MKAMSYTGRNQRVKKEGGPWGVPRQKRKQNTVEVASQRVSGGKGWKKSNKKTKEVWPIGVGACE